MAVRNVLEHPDPRLREYSQPVDRFDERLANLVTDLLDTMYESKSIGLSAPQIDVREQVLVMDHSEDQSAPDIYINPTITTSRHFGLIEERCLSVPEISALVLRATEVHVQAFDVNGEAFERTLTAMPAVCLQHEMDHFEGKLVADRVNWFRRRKLRAAERRALQSA